MFAAEEPIPVGVIGVGNLGRHHARLYHASAGARLVGVADHDLARARSVAGLYGCQAYSDAMELVGRIRAASIAVPTAMHRQVAEPLLEAGVDVLIEKPLARTLDEADALISTAQRNSRLVMVGHSERFNPAVVVLAREVRAPRFFEIHRLAGFTARSTDIDVVLDLMIHDLDLLLHLDGTEPISVDAVGVAALTDKVDIANARIRMASGCVANITSSRISAEPSRRVRVFQERTYLSCDTGARSVDRYRLVLGEGAAPRIEHLSLPVGEDEPLQQELAAFLHAVRTRSAPSVDGWQGRRALALAHQVREAIDGSGLQKN